MVAVVVLAVDVAVVVVVVNKTKKRNLVGCQSVWGSNSSYREAHPRVPTVNLLRISDGMHHMRKEQEQTQNHLVDCCIVSNARSIKGIFVQPRGNENRSSHESISVGSIRRDEKAGRLLLLFLDAHKPALLRADSYFISAIIIIFPGISICGFVSVQYIDSRIHQSIIRRRERWESSCEQETATESNTKTHLGSRPFPTPIFLSKRIGQECNALLVTTLTTTAATFQQRLATPNVPVKYTWSRCRTALGGNKNEC